MEQSSILSLKWPARTFSASETARDCESGLFSRFSDWSLQKEFTDNTTQQHALNTKSSIFHL